MVWFRIGSLRVTTTVFVAIAAAVGSLVSIFVGPLYYFGAMMPKPVLAGQVWRLVTWPFVEPFSIWTVVSIAIFWYFGKLIEEELGRNKMASFLAGLWGIVTATYFFAGLLLPGYAALAGISSLELLLILLFIAEAPNRPFFFGIPAWVVGAVLLALQLIPLAATGNLGSLLALAVSLIGAAYWAKRHGLLAGVTWLPGSSPRRRQKRNRLTVMQPTTSTKAERKARNAEARLDSLLDKINASGMGSLSKAELAELRKLSQRRKRS